MQLCTRSNLYCETPSLFSSRNREIYERATVIHGYVTARTKPSFYYVSPILEEMYGYSFLLCLHPYRYDQISSFNKTMKSGDGGSRQRVVVVKQMVESCEKIAEKDYDEETKKEEEENYEEWERLDELKRDGLGSDEIDADGGLYPTEWPEETVEMGSGVQTNKEIGCKEKEEEETLLTLEECVKKRKISVILKRKYKIIKIFVKSYGYEAIGVDTETRKADLIEDVVFLNKERDSQMNWLVMIILRNMEYPSSRWKVS